MKSVLMHKLNEFGGSPNAPRRKEIHSLAQIDKEDIKHAILKYAANNDGDYLNMAVCLCSAIEYINSHNNKEIFIRKTIVSGNDRDGESEDIFVRVS